LQANLRADQLTPDFLNHQEQTHEEFSIHPLRRTSSSFGVTFSSCQTWHHFDDENRNHFDDKDWNDFNDPHWHNFYNCGWNHLNNTLRSYFNYDNNVNDSFGPILVR
jgi:hypothetical protein